MQRFLVFSFMLMTAITFAQSIVEGEAATRIDTYMNELAEAGFAGALLIAQDGEIILAKGYGLADREHHIPVTPETVVTTGSITKQFTAAAILKLEQEGKLSVTDTITSYFDNVPINKETITLHQLLTHTAGLPQALGEDFEEISRDEYVAKAMLTPLEHRPGETFEYSNVGYALLAAIIEQLSGQPYEAFLQEHLFEPAGMTKTGYVLPDWQENEMAHGYLENGEDWGTMVEKYQTEDGPNWNLMGNGGILSTPLDMYKWHLALLGNDIISEASKEKMFTPTMNDYGYGWDVLDTDQGTLITHNGGNGIFFADFLRFTDAGVVIYVTSSAGEPKATKLGGQLARMVFEPDYAPLAEGTPLTLEALQALDIGQHALAFLELLAGESEDDIRNFINERLSPSLLEAVPAETLFEGIKRDQEEIGATELKSVHRKGENVLELYVISEVTGDTFTLTLSFEEVAPHRITGIGVEN